eukprot:scaffold16570_cov124-Amphora_coffeaeformis.AAC.2
MPLGFLRRGILGTALGGAEAVVVRVAATVSSLSSSCALWSTGSSAGSAAGAGGGRCPCWFSLMIYYVIVEGVRVVACGNR